MAKSAMMDHSDDALNLSDNTRSMVKAPDHLEQKETNNIDEMERLLQQIYGGAGSGNGGQSAMGGSSIEGKGAVKKKAG